MGVDSASAPELSQLHSEHRSLKRRLVEQRALLAERRRVLAKLRHSMGHKTRSSQRTASQLRWCDKQRQGEQISSMSRAHIRVQTRQRSNVPRTRLKLTRRKSEPEPEPACEREPDPAPAPAPAPAPEPEPEPGPQSGLQSEAQLELGSDADKNLETDKLQRDEVVVDLKQLRQRAAARHGILATPRSRVHRASVGRQTLWQASAAGDLVAMQRWVEHDGVSVDAKDPTSYGHKPHSVSPQLDSLGGKTPLYHAVSNGQLDAVKYLLAKGAHVDPKYSGGTLVLPGEVKTTSVMMPTRAAQPERSWSDVAAEAATYTEINDGSLSSKLHSPLHVAASRGDAAIVRVLVAATADVAGEDGDWNTPLHLAASADVVQLLLQAGAGRCMTKTNKVQRTPEREMAARSWTWDEREAPLKEFEAWPRLIGALQRLAWCRGVLWHKLCCGTGISNERGKTTKGIRRLGGSPRGTTGHSGDGQSQVQRQPPVLLSLDLAEMVVEMLASTSGCTKEIATRSGRIGCAANHSVICKDAQERVQELWAARGSKLSAQVEAKLLSVGKRQGEHSNDCNENSGEVDTNVIAECVLCHIKTSRWCAGCAGISADSSDLETSDDEEEMEQGASSHTTLRYCEGSVFTSSPKKAVAADPLPPARPWWAVAV